ncbi:hypothetical protein DF281_00145 [Kurthia zopfii]|uniref:hypothetical protein n=1 Tax=Kurthia zopfii TaxID=1650 RepID=UPI000D6844B7|nr:hypothetical protein [Kurthia zopfii]PWI23940.1 hypothetical protein DF281_00145 [Kurthia zopfii]
MQKEKALLKVRETMIQKEKMVVLVLIFIFVITVIGSCGAMFKAVDEELQKGSVGTERVVSNVGDSNSKEDQEKVEKKILLLLIQQMQKWLLQDSPHIKVRFSVKQRNY